MSQHTSLSLIAECDDYGPLDVIVVMDSSSSVPLPEFNRTKRFIISVLGEFDIGLDSDETRVGIEVLFISFICG